jgi:hypothetical protein
MFIKSFTLLGLTKQSLTLGSHVIGIVKHSSKPGISSVQISEFLVKLINQ